jgi:hypothetical protein
VPVKNTILRLFVLPEKWTGIPVAKASKILNFFKNEVEKKAPRYQKEHGANEVS